jgi:hypothetical protein
MTAGPSQELMSLAAANVSKKLKNTLSRPWGVAIEMWFTWLKMLAVRSFQDLEKRL